MIKEIAKKEELTEIVVFDVSAPQQAMQVANTLKEFVAKNKLTANIQGKQYPLVEAWTFAGAQFGLIPIVVEIKDLSNENEVKYSAVVEVLEKRTGNVIGRGFAICSNKEKTKKLFDEYAICSMAQTRATGKAFRIPLGWLLKDCGFEATPAEEMDFATAKETQQDVEILDQWKQLLDACNTVEELNNLFNSNKPTDKKIIALFTARKQQLVK